MRPAAPKEIARNRPQTGRLWSAGFVGSGKIEAPEFQWGRNFGSNLARCTALGPKRQGHQIPVFGAPAHHDAALGRDLEPPIFRVLGFGAEAATRAPDLVAR